MKILIDIDKNTVTKLREYGKKHKILYKRYGKMEVSLSGVVEELIKTHPKVNYSIYRRELPD